MAPPAMSVANVSDRARVIETVVAAFVSDPAFRYFFADDATYPVEAAAFAGYLFDKRVAGGAVWLIEGGAAVSMWDAPGSVPAASAVLDLPVGPATRLLAYDAAVHSSLPNEPHWYLGVLATDPAHAGKRWGRMAMEVGLARAALDGLPAYLETTSPSNVELYGRSGWKVDTHVAANPPSLGINVWVMKHLGVVP